jgi:hypothetical protein
MNKAIIIEVSNRHLIVLAEGGEFKKIRKTSSSYRVGQEISIPSANPKKRDFRFPDLFNWKTGTAVSLALILLFFQVFLPFIENDAYAFVGMDMDPSIELKIDEDMQVLEIKAFNEEGKQVLQHLDDWKNEDITYVTNLIFETTEELGFLDKKQEVLITTTLSEDIPENKEKEIKERVNKVMTETAEKKEVAMTTIVVSSKEREKAKDMKISPGHYAIYSAAKRSGISITKEEIASQTIEEISKKVGPIKELLKDSEDTDLSSSPKEQNQVYEPPSPVIDQKPQKEEKAQKAAPEQEKKNEQPDKTTTDNTFAKKEAIISSKAEIGNKNEESKQAVAVVPKKGTNNKFPIKDNPSDLNHEKQTEGKKNETSAKNEQSNEETKESNHQAIEDKKEEKWIQIDILIQIDGSLLTVNVKTDAKILKDQLKNQTFALIDQNPSISESTIVSSQNLKPLADVKKSDINISLNDQDGNNKKAS